MVGKKGPPYSVFVGNIAYEATDEQMRQLFSEVGPCVGFRIMLDKDNNKPKGYGFADYMDQSLMDAAVRLLNGRDVHGRPIRVDFADHSDRERIRGPPGPNAEPPAGQMSAVAAAQMASVLAGSGGSPDGPAADAITKRLSELPPAQMYDLMAQVRVLVQADPQGTRQLLLQNPQFARALFQMQIILGMLRAPGEGPGQGGMGAAGPMGMGAAPGPGGFGGLGGMPQPGGFGGPGGLPPPPQHLGIGGFAAPQMGLPPQQGAPGVMMGAGGMAPMGGAGVMQPGFGMQGGAMGQPGMPFGVPPQQQPVMQAGGFAPGPQGAPGMWGAPAAVPQAQPQFGGVGLPPLDPAQQVLLNQILQYTPDQINALPEDKRQQVLQLVQIARQRGMF